MSAPASAVIETTVTVPALIGIPGPQGATGPIGPPGTQEFTVAGNSGAAQTISNGDTLTLTSPVSFQQVVMSAVDTATFSWPNQTGNVFLASPANGSAGTPAFRAIVFADLDAVLGTMAQQDANAVAITGGTAILTTLQADTHVASNLIRGLTLSGNQVQFSAVQDGVLLVANSQSAVWNGQDFRPGTGSARDIGVTGTRWRDLWLSRDITAGRNASITGNLTVDTQTLFVDATNNRAGINTITPASDLHVIHSDAGTNDTQNVMILGRNSTGTPAANFASRTLWQLESSTTENRDAAAIDVLWTTATDATRTSRMDFYLTNAGVLTNVAVLSPTNLNVALSIRPSATVTYDLGTAAARWASVYSSQFITDASNAHIIADGGASGGIISYTTSADTNVATRPLWIFSHRGGTAAAGFGGRIVTQLESSTTNDVNASAQETSWVDPTHGSRTARVRHLVYDTAEREYLRGEASGSAPMIGFLGANAIVRPTVTGSRGGIAAVASLLTELANLGLIVDNTTA